MNQVIKILVFAGIGVCNIYCAFAQTPEPVIARAVYTYQHQLDTTKDDRYKEDMLLVLGKTASVFTSLDKQYQNEILYKQQEEQTKAWTGEDFPTFNFTVNRYATPTEYFNFRAEHKLFVKDFLGQIYFFEDDYPNIPWQLTNDTVTIAGYKCKTASATFKGRKWIVAYAPSLPFSAGPWKLGGLPGLIVDAHDSKNQISYRLNSFVKQDNGGSNYIQDDFQQVNYLRIPTIQLPPERHNNIKNTNIQLIKITKNEALKLYTARDKDPMTFLQGQLSLRRGTDDVQSVKMFLKKPKCNNPIEKD